MVTIKLSLWDFLGAIPDPWAASGRRFTLQSVLGIIIAGTLTGRYSIHSIARWAKSLTEEDLRLLARIRMRISLEYAQEHFIRAN
jgi:hypothetical protein